MLEKDCKKDYQSLGYKKRNDRKIFYSSPKLIASDSDIDEPFKSMHQRITTKTKNYACKDQIFLDVIIKNNIKIFYQQYKENKQH